MEYASGNIFIREMAFEKVGSVIEGHAHNFDHTTYVVRGSVKVEALDASGAVVKTAIKRAVDGHNWVLIRADTSHRLTALEDNSMGHCIYSHRNPQGEIVESYDGWMEGYQ